MKKSLFLFLGVYLFSGLSFANEINYYNKSWAEIKAKALAEHKYIFVDCYTDWCGWCKVMDKETMTDDGIVSLMNDKFIPVKMEMEKGEGIKIAMKYHISGFPTFIFFNPQGELVYQSVGYQKTPDFTKELNNALDKSKEFSAPGYSASVDIDFPEFYKNIFAGNGKRKFPKEEEVTAFLDLQKDLFSEINWGVISRCDLNEKYTKFFFENIDKYKKLYGENSVADKVNSLINAGLQKAIKTKSKTEFENTLKISDKYVTDDPETNKIYLKVSFYQAMKEWDKCAATMDEYIAKKGFENSEYINSLSWGMYEGCTDKKLLNKAGTWMKAVLAKEPQYAFLDTYAAILYKSGQVKDAEVWANKAIEEGKKSGSNTTSTEELLKKIKGGK